MATKKLSYGDIRELRMEIGEVKIFKEGFQIRRVFGGYMYEYLKDKIITAVCFVSTDELRNE